MHHIQMRATRATSLPTVLTLKQASGGGDFLVSAGTWRYEQQLYDLSLTPLWVDLTLPYGASPRQP